MAQQLLDGFGRPASVISASPGPYVGSAESEYRLNTPRMDYDWAALLPRHKHQLMVSDARYIASAFSVVRGAVTQKADYVSAAGWTPQFNGEDQDWGSLAETVLWQANEIADVRGRPFSFHRNWWIGSQCWDVDGDFFILLVRGPNGFPFSQHLEAHRIGQRLGQATVQGGRYDGARMINGVIYNDSGRAIAYNVLGSTSERDTQVSARDMIHVWDPVHFSDNRGWPSIAYSVFDWYDIKETREAEKIAQKANSALTMTETTETGKKLLSANPGGIPLDAAEESAAAAQAPQVSMLQNGLIRYVKSGSGGIQAHESNRPSNGWLAFDEKIESGAFYGMDWRREMMNLKDLTTGAIHAFAGQINTSIARRHGAMAPYALQETRWRVACLIDRGDIPPHPEWDQWELSPPPIFTGNPSRVSQSDREDARAGIKTLPQLIRMQGRDPEDHLIEIAKFEKLKETIADRFEINVEKLGRLDKPGDNPAQPSTANPPAAQ